jgi:hypothetical protein
MVIFLNYFPPEAAPEIGHPKGCKVDFLVDDVRQAAEEFKNAGIEVGPVYSEFTQEWTNYRAPDGNFIWLPQYAFSPFEPNMEQKKSFSIAHMKRMAT